MILVINTLEDKQVVNMLDSSLKFSNIKYEIVHTADMDIYSCVGCDYCWLKT